MNKLLFDMKFSRRPAVFLAGFLLFFVGTHLFTGCSKEDWLGKEKKATLKAEIENLWPKQPALLINKKNDFAWHNVTFTIWFTLSEKYELTIPVIKEGPVEFTLNYSDFKHIKTGQPYDPSRQGQTADVMKLRIEGDEGYWY